MIRSVLLLCSLLCLSACGTFTAHEARTKLIGATEPDILSCMGPPDKTQYISPHQHVMGWMYTQTGTDLDAKFGLYALTIGRPGICKASIRMESGFVTGVHYQDEDINPTDPDSVCGRIVQECVRHREHTALPADFDADRLLLGPKDLVKY